MKKIEDPAFNYDQRSVSYSSQRKTEPAIAAYIHAAMGSAKNVLNIGAGSGSYEPDDRYVISVEPSSSMRQQRKELNRRPALIAFADNLPFDDHSFDASMALLTIHHWPDVKKGLNEMNRVTNGRILIMTYDPDSLHTFWNAEYFPELTEVEKARYPKIDTLTKILGGNCQVLSIPIPLMCQDGFQEAYYGRPEEFLKPEVRKAQSAWCFLPDGLEEKYVESFAKELSSGNWDKKYAQLRSQSEYFGALKLILKT